MRNATFILVLAVAVTVVVAEPQFFRGFNNFFRGNGNGNRGQGNRGQGNRDVMIPFLAVAGSGI